MLLKLMLGCISHPSSDEEAKEYIEIINSIVKIILSMKKISV
jgi:hypothetical protein